ncbi:MAG: hypothetical protein NTV05_08825 [Acidobacteria bacterium]|nr:hypothetical protein [Acidobacteriota bacterium]
MRAAGFTERQARFLVLVLEHAGVCLPRQYRTFAGIAHGRQTHRFFEQLITGGFATTGLSAPAHAGRIYHVQYKPWYRAIGEPDHRHRKAMSVGRAVERLMVLDGVLAEPSISWLGLFRDKAATFTNPPAERKLAGDPWDFQPFPKPKEQFAMVKTPKEAQHVLTHFARATTTANA